MRYVNCDLPAAEDMLRDPQLFFRSCAKPVVVFEEIHQLRDPARLLEHLQALFPDLPVRYWHDKSGREVDFVLAHRRDAVDAIECKWNPDAFDSSALQVFRGFYPKGRNYLVTPSADPAYTRRFGKLEVRVCTPSELQP